MKKSRSIIPVSTLWLPFAWFLITSCTTITPPGEVLFYQPPSRPALSSQQRANLTDEDIKQLIKRGDEEYASGRYSDAKDIYYEVLLARPNPNVDVLISYGACLAKLQAYENAIDIFNVALEKDPGNVTAKGNIAVCRQRLAEQSETQRKLALQQQQQQRENFNNLIASLNAAAELAGEIQNNRGGGQASQSNSGGGQGQAGTSSGSSSNNSSSSGRNKNPNEASMQQTYNTRAKATEDAYFQLQRSINNRDSSSTINRLSSSLKSHQKDLISYRKECKGKGVDINPSMYETAWP